MTDKGYTRFSKLYRQQIWFWTIFVPMWSQTVATSVDHMTIVVDFSVIILGRKGSTYRNVTYLQQAARCSWPQEQPACDRLVCERWARLNQRGTEPPAGQSKGFTGLLGTTSQRCEGWIWVKAGVEKSAGEFGDWSYIIKISKKPQRIWECKK